jgi:hypothetical protein
MEIIENFEPFLYFLIIVPVLHLEKNLRFLCHDNFFN